jgi:D-alanyl-D-alanine carboxypeptidase/D-alanyl-D-alanine-endopeptidase (penicillin-binding protein 4)
VRKPDVYAGEVFVTFARAHGIALDSIRPTRRAPQGTALVTRKSPPLRDILRGMLKYSNNLTAELVGITATQARAGQAGSLRASARAMSRWAAEELGMTDARLVDHSGLGEDSRLSARSMALALVRAHRSGTLRSILKDIPMRDKNGRVDKGHPVKVEAKTGTLYFVSSLAGYMTAEDGRVMAFAIFAADTDRRSRIDRDARGRPPGARGWNRRAKDLQQALIERWNMVYGS